MKLSALRYYGGKSERAPNGISKWISEHLQSPARKSTYIEPFAGMLGILLQRSRSKVEIANDLNGEIVNWWEMVRDRGPELKEKLYNTPYSEKEFHLAKTDTDDLLEQARRTTIKLISGLTAGVYSRAFSVRYDGRSYGTRHTFRPYADRIPALQDRIHNVALLCRPAEKVLTRLAKESHAMIYCDPPYKDADTEPYGDYPFDRDLFGEVVQQQTGAVAISGYGDEWDHLGWVRNEFQTYLVTVGSSGDRPARTEVLWTNYQPAVSQITMFD